MAFLKDRRRDFNSREKEMPWGSWHVVMWMKGIENIAYHGIGALGQGTGKDRGRTGAVRCLYFVSGDAWRACLAGRDIFQVFLV